MGFGFYTTGFGTVLAVFEGRLCDLQGRFQPRWGSCCPLGALFARTDPVVVCKRRLRTIHRLANIKSVVICAAFFFSPR